LPPHSSAPPSTPLSTLSLHDALPISGAHMDRHRAREDAVLIVEFVAEHRVRIEQGEGRFRDLPRTPGHQDDLTRLGLQPGHELLDRKSTRLNSSHQIISYAVFCLKKK